MASAAPITLNSRLAFQSYRALTARGLSHFLHGLYHDYPEFTQGINTIILDGSLDGPWSSFVYEMLYGVGGYDLKPYVAAQDECEANVVKIGKGPGDIVKSGVNWRAASTQASPSLKYEDHPFVRACEDIFLTTMEWDVQTIKREGGLELYVRTVASLLTVCENLEDLYLPKAWVKFFPTKDFPRLKHVFITEDYDEWGL